MEADRTYVRKTYLLDYDIQNDFSVHSMILWNTYAVYVLWYSYWSVLFPWTTKDRMIEHHVFLHFFF
jgi:hypothetical protein